MNDFSITRRGWIAAAAGLPLSGAAARAQRDDPPGDARPKDAAEVITRLKEGNPRAPDQASKESL